MTLSAEMAAILEMFKANPPQFPTDVSERRAALDQFMSGPCAEGVTEEGLFLGDRFAVQFTPSTDHGRAILYLHGGAYQVGSIDAYRSFASRLAAELASTVFVVDYRLAPEHPFPAAVKDAMAAYAALLSAGHDPSRVAVMGDSAGGGLTVALLLAIDEERFPQPAAAVSLSGWLDLTNSGESYERCAATDPFVNHADSERGAAAYLNGADPRDPLASPVFAKSKVLGRLAPLLLQASASEVLTDDSSTMADRIIDAGGIVELQLYDDLTHVWQQMPGTIPEVAEANAAIGAFLDQHIPRH